MRRGGQFYGPQDHPIGPFAASPSYGAASRFSLNYLDTGMLFLMRVRQDVAPEVENSETQSRVILGV